MTSWNSALKVDEEKGDELQIKKTESLRKAHQKDRLSLQSRRTPSGGQSSTAGTISSSTSATNTISSTRNSSYTANRGNCITSVTNTVNGGVPTTLPVPVSHQGVTSHQTRQTARSDPPHQHPKNENGHRKKKKRNPPHLASLTYLTSISNQRISVS